MSGRRPRADAPTWPRRPVGPVNASGEERQDPADRARASESARTGYIDDVRRPGTANSPAARLPMPASDLLGHDQIETTMLYVTLAGSRRWPPTMLYCLGLSVSWDSGSATRLQAVSAWMPASSSHLVDPEDQNDCPKPAKWPEIRYQPPPIARHYSDGFVCRQWQRGHGECLEIQPAATAKLERAPSGQERGHPKGQGGLPVARPAPGSRPDDTIRETRC